MASLNMLLLICLGIGLQKSSSLRFNTRVMKKWPPFPYFIPVGQVSIYPGVVFESPKKWKKWNSIVARAARAMARSFHQKVVETEAKDRYRVRRWPVEMRIPPATLREPLASSADTRMRIEKIPETKE